MQELGREGCELKHVTSVVSGGGGENIVTTSRIYLFWAQVSITN